MNNEELKAGTTAQQSDAADVTTSSQNSAKPHVSRSCGLTNEEKAILKALNFVATYDGIITSEDNIKYLLNQAIEKFIPKSRQHLVSVTETVYPVRIKY